MLWTVRKLLGRVSLWSADQKGNISTTFALTLIPLMTMIGMTLDFSRTEGASRQVQYALDGAVLAAARALQETDADTKIEKAAQDYFNAALNANSVTSSCGDIGIKILKQEHSVEASITCRQPTTLSAIVGLNNLEFTRFAKTAYGVGKLDIVFMFDTSGSMGNDGRMDDLQDAAKDAVKELFKSKTEKKDDVRIAVSTYASSVNVGADYFKAVTNDDPPEECVNWVNVFGFRFCVASTTSTCVTGREGSAQYTDAAPGTNRWIKYETTDCNSATLTPLTYTQGHVISAIETLPTSGSTAGHLGIAWAWYLISPNWSSIWPADSKPRAYDEPDSTKIAILMTDGEFNKDYMSGGNSFAHAKKFCDAMKAEDIVIYTVAFKAPKSGQDILEYCASGSVGMFAFQASDGQQLADAYKAIATNISDLRLAR